MRMGDHLRRLVVFWIIFLPLVVTGCGGDVFKPPELGGIYNRSAQYHGHDRNPIILIPGILGSRLVDEDMKKTIWGAFLGTYADPSDPEGVRSISLPMEEGASLAELRDGVRPDGALDSFRVRLFGLPFEQQAYVYILSTLGVGGYRDEAMALSGAVDYGDDHFTCFQFDYDWRRDNVENAMLLHDFILEKQEYVAAEIKKRFGVDKPDVKFDIVAHSMGGLVARYFLRYGSQDLPADGSLPREVPWAGSDLVERVILVGTPNSGSPDALLQLVEGMSISKILPAYGPGLLGTMPSIYQLLPRPRHKAVVDRSSPEQPLDLYDIRLWGEMGWGLANPKVDEELQVLLPRVSKQDLRRFIARDHLKKCLQRARQFAAALDIPASPPDGLKLHLMAGDAEPTLSVIGVDRSTGKLEAMEYAAGDGRVLRSSALADERVGGEWQPRLVSPIEWSKVFFIYSDHLGITRDPIFTDNVLHFLLESPS
jgi:pimeloyl-ACP methyl ester carboxylesterase